MKGYYKIVDEEGDFAVLPYSNERQHDKVIDKVIQIQVAKPITRVIGVDLDDDVELFTGSEEAAQIKAKSVGAAGIKYIGPVFSELDDRGVYLIVLDPKSPWMHF